MSASPDAKSRTCVSFVVTSDVTSLESLSTMLAHPPTVLHIKGEERPSKYGVVVYPGHLWRYSLYDRDVVSTKLEQYLKEMLGFLKARRAAILDLLGRDDLEVSLTVWATVDADVAKLTLNAALWRELLEYCREVHLYIDAIQIDEDGTVRRD